MRDMCFASPKFPRLTNSNLIKETIVRGVSSGMFAYVGKSDNGKYDPFYFDTTLRSDEVEITSEMFLLPKDIAEKYKLTQSTTAISDIGQAMRPPVEPFKEDSSQGDQNTSSDSGTTTTSTTESHQQSTHTTSLSWTGAVPPQKWMNFYTKVLTRFAANKELKLTISFEIHSEEGISAQKIDETRTSLKELGLKDDLEAS